MASIGCIGALGNAQRGSKPGKNTRFGKLKCEIQLKTPPNGILHPFDTISGLVVVKPPPEGRIRFGGLRMQLDANVEVYFSKGSGPHLVNCRALEGLFPGSSEPDSDFYISSPIQQQLIDEDPTTFALREFPPGISRFPFSLKMLDATMPAQFNAQSGNLKYKLVVYMMTREYVMPVQVQIAEKLLRFGGYHNLSTKNAVLAPLKFEKCFNTSLFSSKNAFTVTLALDKDAFLPGEEIPFKIQLGNPAHLKVKFIVATLNERITYTVKGESKSTLSNLGAWEMDAGEIQKHLDSEFSGTFSLPKNCRPTFRLKEIYNVSHFIQYQLDVPKYSGAVKGTVDVTIGTTREPVQELKSAAVARNSADDELLQLQPMARSTSVMSTLSDTSSVMSALSFPPNYSQLPSRSESMYSLETLPPHFDDLKLTQL